MKTAQEQSKNINLILQVSKGLSIQLGRGYGIGIFWWPRTIGDFLPGYAGSDSREESCKGLATFLRAQGWLVVPPETRLDPKGVATISPP